MNRHGQAARFAYDPDVVVAFFDALPRTEFYRDEIHGRIIRRWRGAKGVTRPSFERMLQCYTVSTARFEEFCAALNLEPVLRDKDANRR